MGRTNKPADKTETAREKAKPLAPIAEELSNRLSQYSSTTYASLAERKAALNNLQRAIELGSDKIEYETFSDCADAPEGYKAAVEALRYDIAATNEFNVRLGNYRLERLKPLLSRDEMLKALITLVKPVNYFGTEKQYLDFAARDDRNTILSSDYKNAVEALKGEIQAFDASMDKINTALQSLTRKIGTIDKHLYTDAFDAATTLLATLNTAKDNYTKNITMAGKQQFAVDCTIAIERAMPVLQRDLGWGSYLKNLLKTMIDTVVGIVTLGYSGRFFTPERPQSVNAVDDFKKELDM